ncbi:hypothetical protein ASG06_05485 [Rathayibacter sp. Leaf185]|nr:hypothetical protein ASF42_05475 [Rathayibacter sp. Leaf294]KQS13846.1 hypothetical protein ASG06_05485 [Rathayibacter sp. Leaf185]
MIPTAGPTPTSSAPADVPDSDGPPGGLASTGVDGLAATLAGAFVVLGAGFLLMLLHRRTRRLRS